MKTFLVCLMGILLSQTQAFAYTPIIDGVMYPQICYIQGQTSLKFFNDDSVQGTISDKEIYLAYYQNHIYGEIDFVSVDMFVRQDGTVDLYINQNRMLGFSEKPKYKLYFDGEKIFGSFPCVGPGDTVTQGV